VALQEEARTAVALQEEARTAVTLQEETRMAVALQEEARTAAAAETTKTVASTRSGLWSGTLVPVLGGLPSPKPTTSSGPRS